MDSHRWEALLAWIGQHPLLAGAVIFLIAFGDALVIVGVAIPAVPLLFAVGTLIGLGSVEGAYALACATAGAVIGDGLSYWVGRRYGERLRGFWPFRTHPQWLAAGERSFRRHGMKSLLIARFVGAIRPFVPAIAGMVRMPVKRYLPASIFAGVLWSACLLLPGWVFGTSLDLISAVAGRLSILLGALLLALATIYGLVFYAWRLVAPRAAGLIERALAWSHRHPVLGRYSEALIDPNRPESASLLMLGSALVLAAWGFFTLMLMLGGGSAPSALDQWVHQAMFGLRNPLGDQAMAFLATLGEPLVLAPAVLLVFAWLWWRQRREAAWHWLAAPAFGLILTAVLGWLVDLPKPPAATAAAGFGFPSFTVTLATVVFGFFAVLIARDLPGRRRVWPYVVAAFAVTLNGFARLYLGAHWLSDVLGGILLGVLWIMLLGIAYRRRRVRQFWIKPVSVLFFAAVAAMWLWRGPQLTPGLLARFDLPVLRQDAAMADWWNGRDLRLPARRNELRGRDAWPLNVQVAGELDAIGSALAARGWHRVQPGGWTGLLQILDKQASAGALPILPAAHHGQAEALLLAKPGADPESRWVLRLWAAPYRLQPGAQPLWIGTVQGLRFARRYDYVSFWEAQPDHEAALAQLAGDAADFEHASAGGAAPVLRLRTHGAAIPAGNPAGDR